jgi:hypothetical protein
MNLQAPTLIPRRSEATTLYGRGINIYCICNRVNSETFRDILPAVRHEAVEVGLGISNMVGSCFRFSVVILITTAKEINGRNFKDVISPLALECWNRVLYAL